MLQLLTVLSLASAAAASYASNLNYRSPSHNHPGLGISIHKVNKRNGGSPAYNASQLNFTHGVASGDPYPNSVILWTRCAPMSDNVNDNSTVSGYVPLYNPVPIYNDTDQNAPPSTAPICLNFQIATDMALTQVVDSGVAYTSSDIDYTLKVPFDQRKLLTVQVDKFDRSKPRSLVRTLNITTNSASAAPIIPAHLEGPKLLPQPTTT